MACVCVWVCACVSLAACQCLLLAIYVMEGILKFKKRNDFAVKTDSRLLSEPFYCAVCCHPKRRDLGFFQSNLKYFSNIIWMNEGLKPRSFRWFWASFNFLTNRKCRAVSQYPTDNFEFTYLSLNLWITTSDLHFQAQWSLFEATAATSITPRVVHVVLRNSTNTCNNLVRLSHVTFKNALSSFTNLPEVTSCVMIVCLSVCLSVSITGVAVSRFVTPCGFRSLLP